MATECSTTQRWKLNETLSKKEGVRRSIYEINRKRGASSSESKSAESEWEIGKTYTGEWSNDMRDGYGVQIWSNHSKYEGEWKRDQRNGFGVHWIPLPTDPLAAQPPSKRKDDVTWIYDKNGQQLASHTSENVSALLRIRDELCAQQKTGKRKRSKSAQSMRLHKQYEGEWRDDEKHGKGTFYYQNGDKFEGLFARNQRSGYGVMQYANGDKYEGDWKLNKRNGFGIYLTGKDQSLYTGYWMNGEKEGPGHFEKDGTLYVAEWVHGTPRSGYFVEAKDKQAMGSGAAQIKLKLLRPDHVLSEEVKKIRSSRKLIRSLSIIDDIDDLFEEQQEVKLKVLDIYAQISFGDNCVEREDLMQSVLDFELAAKFDETEQDATDEDATDEHEAHTKERHAKLKLCVAKHCDDLGVRKSSASERENVVFVVTQLEYAKIIYLLLHDQANQQ